MTPEEIVAREKGRQKSQALTPDAIVAREKSAMSDSARGSLRVTRDMQPDQAAEVIELATRRDVDFGTAWRQRETLKAAEQEASTSALLSQSPKLTSALTDPKFAAVSQDSLKELAEIEAKLSQRRTSRSAPASVITGIPNALWSGVLGIRASAEGAMASSLQKPGGAAQIAVEAYADKAKEAAEPVIGAVRVPKLFRTAPWKAGRGLPDVRVPDLGLDDAVARAQQNSITSAVEARQAANEAMPDTGDRIGNDVLVGVRSAVEMLPSIAIAIASRNPALGSAVMERQVSGGSFAEAIEAGADPEKAVLFGSVQGRLEYYTERLFRPLDIITGGKSGGIVRRLVLGQLSEQAQEQTATLTQDFVEWQMLNPEKTPQEYAAERWDRALSTAISTLVATGAIQGATEAANAARRTVETSAAQETANSFNTLRDVVEQTPVFQRQRESVQKFIEDAGENETILLDDEGLTQLYQSDPEGFSRLMQLMDISEDQISAAMDGNDVEIPAARLLTLPERTDYDALIDIARTSPEAMTLAESRQAAEADAQQVDIADLQERLQDETAALEGFERVESTVRQQLIDAGRSPQEAEAAGAIWGSVFRVFAEDGVDEATVFERLGLRVQGPGQEASSGEIDAAVLKQAKADGFEGDDIEGAQEWEAARAKGLDMSQAGRKARAKDMGFDTDTVMYHGTADDFEAFASSQPVFLTSKPDSAAAYAARAGRNKMREAGGPTPAQSAELSGLKSDIYANQFAKKRAILPATRDKRSAQENEALQGYHDRVGQMQTEQGGNIRPVYAKLENPLLVEDMKRYSSEGMEAAIARAQKGGHDGLVIRNMFDEWGQEVADYKVIFNPSNIRSVNAAFDPDMADSANLLHQSAPNNMTAMLRLTDEQIGEWYVENVTETTQELSDGYKVVNLQFKSNEALDRPDAFVNLKVENGKVSADMYLEGRTAANERMNEVPDSERRERVAQANRLFVRGIMALKHWVALEQPDAVMFSGSSEAHNRLYEYLLSRMAFEGYGNHQVSAIIGGMTDRAGETTGEALIPQTDKFVVLKEGLNLDDFTDTETEKGREGRDIDGNPWQGLHARHAREIGPVGSADRGNERSRLRTGTDGAGRDGSGNDLFQLIGPRAKGADKAILNQAKKMFNARSGLRRKKTYTRQQIWDKTAEMGQPWYRDNKGDWISEIEDGSVVVKEEKGKVSEVIEYPALFDQYPQIGRLRADARSGQAAAEDNGAPDIPGVAGYFNPEPYFWNPHVRISKGTAGQQASVAVHELSHAIDAIEGRLKSRKSYYLKPTERRAFNVEYRRLWTMEERIATPPWKTEQEAINWWAGHRHTAAEPAKYAKPGTEDPGAQVTREEPDLRETPKGLNNLAPGAQNADALDFGEFERQTYFDNDRQMERTRWAYARDHITHLTGRTFMSFKDVATSMKNNPRIAELVNEEAPAWLDASEMKAFRKKLGPDLAKLEAALVSWRAGYLESLPAITRMLFGDAAQIGSSGIREILKDVDAPLAFAVMPVERWASLFAWHARETGPGRAKQYFEGSAEKVLDAYLSSHDEEGGLSSYAVRVFRGEIGGEPPRGRPRTGKTTATQLATDEVRGKLKPRLMDMDKPIGEQSAEHIQALRSLFEEEQARLPKEEYFDLDQELGGFENATPADLITLIASVSEEESNRGSGKWYPGIISALREHGIVGAMYTPGGTYDQRANFNSVDEVRQKIDDLYEQKRIALSYGAEDSWTQGRLDDINNKLIPLEDGLNAFEQEDITEDELLGRVPEEEQAPQVQSILLFDERAPVLLTDHQGNLLQKERASVQIPGALEDVPGAQILSDKDVVVRLTKAADKTSFLHESAHIFLELYGALEADNENVAARMDAIRTFLGVKPGEALTRDQHETFAEAFEAYLMEGKAPSAELKSVFRKFRAWFTEVYRALRGKLPNLTPEARDIFDRMLATDEEISFAQGQYKFTLSKAMQGMMSEAQLARYQSYAAKAGDVARDKLFRKHMDEIKRRERSQYRADKERIEKEVRADIEALPVYRARAEHSDNGKTLREGVEPELIAADYGYATGDSLVKAMSLFPVMEAAVRRETKRRMDALHGDMLTDGTAEAEAIEAVFNEPSVKMLEAERDALAEKAARDAIPLGAIRARADEMINTVPVDDIIKPGRYAIKARDLHKRAIRAAARQNWDQALRYTHQAMLHHELARRAYKAKEEIGKINRFLARYAPHRKLDPKRINPDHITQIRNLMSLPGADNQQEIMETLRRFAESETELGYAVVLPTDVMLGNPLPLRRSMTLTQLREFRDGIRNLGKLGRDQSAAEAQKRRAELDSLAESITDNAGDKHKRGRFDTNDGFGRRLLGMGSSWSASLRKLPYLARVLDGGPDSFGPFYKAVVLPLRAAGGVELDLKYENETAVNDILKRHKLDLGRRVFVTAFNTHMSMEQLWALALNAGNATNMARLLNDPVFDFSEAGIFAALDEHLTKDHWDAAQEVWDFIDTRWPAIAELEKRTTGVTPQKVEATPVQTRHGSYRGGYYPLKYDPDLQKGGAVRDGLATEFDAQVVRGGVMGRTQTRHGHTIARQKNVNRAVWLSLNVLTQHLDEVAHDLAYREAFNRAAIVVNDSTVGQAIQDAVGQDNLKAMREIVERVAQGQIKPRNPIEKMMRTLRVNAASADLGLNVRSILTQPLGLTQSIAKLGAGTMARGSAEYLEDIPGSLKFIMDKSGFMRNRAKIITRDIRDAVSGERSRGAFNRLRGMAMLPMQQLDVMGVAAPTWLAAYRKHMEETGNDAESVLYADGIVADTQGSGLIMDLATIQSGTEFEKLFSYMYGYFSTTLNMTYEAAQISRRQPGRAVSMMILLYTIPGVLAEIVLNGMGGDDDDEIEDRLLRTVLEGHVNQASATMPGLREIVSAVRYNSGQETFYGRLVGGLIRTESSAVKAIGEGDAEAGHRAVVNGIRTAGVALGIPGAGQLARLYSTVTQDDDPTFYEAILTGPDDDN